MLIMNECSFRHLVIKLSLYLYSFISGCKQCLKYLNVYEYLLFFRWIYTQVFFMMLLYYTLSQLMIFYELEETLQMEKHLSSI